MADKSNLIITTTDYLTGNTQQKTITDINPLADNNHLKTFAQMTAGLSKDSYTKSKRVDVTELNGVGKPRTFARLDYNFIANVNTNITSDQTSVTASTNLSNVRVQSGNKTCLIEVTTAFDAAPQILNYSTTGTKPARWANAVHSQYKNGGNDYTNRWNILVWLPNAVAVTTFTLHFDATPTTDAYDLPFTLTVTADEGGE